MMRGEFLMSDDTVMKENMLLEFDFMIEAGIIPDIRDDFIFVEARAALDPNSNPNRTVIG